MDMCCCIIAHVMEFKTKRLHGSSLEKQTTLDPKSFLLHNFLVVSEWIYKTWTPSTSWCVFQTAQTVLVVVVVFCLSWLPHHIVHLWVEFGTFPLNQASFVLRVAAHCLAYSNSSVNPVIYAFLSENFRKAYKQVFRCQIGSSDSLLNNIKEMRSKADTPPSTNCTNVWMIRCGCWQVPATETSCKVSGRAVGVRSGRILIVECGCYDIKAAVLFHESAVH